MAVLRQVLQGSPRLVGVGLEVLASVSVARLLGVSATGYYSIALVTAGFVYAVLEGGANDLGLAATNEDSTRRAWGRKLLVASAAGVAGLIVAPFHRLTGLILIATAILAMERRWGLVRRRRLLWTAVTFALRPLAVIVAAVALAGHNSPEDAVVGVLLSALGASALITTIDHWCGGRLRPRLGGRGYSGSLSTTTVLGLAQHVILNGLVFGFAGPAAAGLYAIALRPLQVVIALLGFQRDLWTSSAADSTKVLQEAVRATPIVAGLSLVAAGVLVVLHPIGWMFGVSSEVDLLAACALAVVPPLWYTSAVGAYFTRAGVYRRLLPPVSGLVATVAVVGIVLVPPLGAAGAVVSLVVGEVVRVALSAWSARSAQPPARSGADGMPVRKGDPRVGRRTRWVRRPALTWATSDPPESPSPENHPPY